MEKRKDTKSTTKKHFITFTEEINDVPIYVYFVCQRLNFFKLCNVLTHVLQETIKSLLKYDFTLFSNESLYVCNQCLNAIK